MNDHARSRAPASEPIVTNGAPRCLTIKGAEHAHSFGIRELFDEKVPTR